MCRLYDGVESEIYAENFNGSLDGKLEIFRIKRQTTANDLRA